MKTTSTLILFVGAWSTASAAAVALPVSFPETAGSFIVFSSLTLHMLLAASLSYHLITAVFKESRNVVVRLCLVLLLVLVSMIGFGKMTGNLSTLFLAVHSGILLSGAAIAGALLSSAVKRLGELIPVCCTAAIADVASVAEGPTSSMIADITTYYRGGMRGEIPLVDFILVKAGIPGYDTVLPFFGVTDWILVSLLSASLLRLGKSDNLLPGKGARTAILFFPVSAAGLLMSLVLARLTDMFIPAMTVMAAVFLLYVAVRFDLRREIQRSDLAYSLLLPSCVAVLVLVFSV